MSKKLSSEEEDWERDAIEEKIVNHGVGEIAYCYGWQILTISTWRHWSGSDINKVSGK